MKEWPKKVSYQVIPEGRICLGLDAPFDGNPVLIRTKIGWVEAWWCTGEKVDYQEGEEYEGFCWVCYDDEFQCELDDAIEWMPIPVSENKVEEPAVEQSVQDLIEKDRDEALNKELIGMLYNADPNCKHVLDPNCFSGVRCLKCPGWYCL